ncbi:MAG: CopD family protein, partial [Candidatus Thermoplasmatota archaeon]|nr:CopD family protein [Candidatus Thermoplasmatota archaeon]
PPQRAGRALALSLLLFFLLTQGLAPTVHAHADLVTAEPGPNTRIPTAPTHLQLTFSEPVSTTYTRIQVLGPDEADRARETRVDRDDARRVTVPLDELPDGVHTVRWRTLSATDGHTRAGVYFLALNATLGDAPAPQAPGDPASSAGTDPGLVEPSLRALAFAGSLLAVGLPLMLLLCQGLALPSPVQRRLTDVQLIAAGTGSLASLGLLASLAQRIEASPLQAAATQNGTLLLVRTGLLAAAALLYLAPRLPVSRHQANAGLGLGALLATASLLATTLGGHAAAGPAPGWPVVNDWLHQIASAVWLSGLVALTLAATGATSERDGASLVRRFSPLAVASVIVLVLTGSLSALEHLPGWRALLTTTYGQALLVKILLLVPLIALGAYHRYVVLPALEVPGQARWDMARLRWSAAAEVGLMAIVLLAAGVLTSMAPPAPGLAPGAEEGIEPLTTFEVDGLNLTLQLTPRPVAVGFQDLYLEPRQVTEDAPDPSEIEAFLVLRPPSNPHGETSSRSAHVLANGTWHWGGALFTEPGTWEATVLLQGPLYHEHTFQVDVAPGGQG